MKASHKKLTPTAVDFFRSFYDLRKERNESYSLTAFARDLGLSVSLVSRVLNGKRPVSLKFGLQVSTALGLTETDHKRFVAAILSGASETAKISLKLRRDLEQDLENTEITPVHRLEIEQFQSMSQWYHLAILNLLRLPDFDKDPVAIARRLGISSVEAQTALDRLQKLGLLVSEKAALKRTTKSLFVKMDRSHLAVRKFHQQMIQKSLEALEDGSSETFQARHITGSTLTCSKKQLETIKDKLDKCHQDIITYLENSKHPSDAVYQLNTQFFPLTKETL